ncbi:MAG: hypothetical protein IJC73_02665 [Lentisphaeria bacterium]|nr:hypothetical protein [Lentisphaeria bacterium]
MSRFRFNPWGITILTAVAVRVWAWCVWQGSPLRSIGRIPGLDCMTHLELGALFRRGQGVFTPYKMLYVLTGGDSRALIGAQLVLGIATALCVAYIMLRLTGKRTAAAIAGAITAVAGNALMYELVPLQESTSLFLTAASMAALLWARKRRFARRPAIVAGIVLGLTGTGRPALLLWVAAAMVWSAWRLWYYRTPKRFGWLLQGLLIVWLPVTVWNIRHAAWPLPWYGSNIQYVASVAASPEITNWNDVPSVRPTAAGLVGGMAAKIGRLFSWQEIPDNLDYYFIAGKFAPVGCLLPPGILVVIGTAGLLLMMPRWRHKEGLVWLWFMTAAAIFTCYYPVGRYRVALTPVWAVAAVWLLMSLRRRPVWAAMALAIVTAGQVCAQVPFLPPYRVSDYTMWMLALEQSGAPAAEIDDAGWQAVAASGGGERETARLLQRLVGSDQLDAAEWVLAHYPGQDLCRRYYAGLIALGRGRAAECRDRLLALPVGELPPELRESHAFYLGEAYRLTGDREAARRVWRPLMESARYRQLIGERLSL